MGHAMNMGPLSLAWDARRATRGGALRIAQRQQARLAALVDFACASTPS
jgi:hypothetical protein